MNIVKRNELTASLRPSTSPTNTCPPSTSANAEVVVVLLGLSVVSRQQVQHDSPQLWRCFGRHFDVGRDLAGPHISCKPRVGLALKKEKKRKEKKRKVK
jgi:hypothetical protein